MEPNGSVWEQVRDRAERIGQLVGDMRPDSEFELLTTHFYILGMFWRSVRLFDGIVTLTKAELPEEATILCRSLFEDSVRLEQLAKEPDLREGLMISWANQAIIERRELLKYQQRLELSSDIATEMAVLDKQQKDVQSYAVRHKVAKYERFLSTKDGAKRFKRDADDMWFYELSHHMVHGGDLAWLFARRATSDVAGLHAKTAEPRVRAGVVGFAVTALTKSAESVVEIFGWSLPVELKRLNEEITSIMTKR